MGPKVRHQPPPPTTTWPPSWSLDREDVVLGPGQIEIALGCAIPVADVGRIGSKDRGYSHVSGFADEKA